MINYVHNISTRLYFGKGQIENLADILNAYGKTVLLTYGKGSIKKTGLYDEVMAILNGGGFNVVELEGINSNPSIDFVIEGAKLCREHSVDVILAVGGGSVLDCSKAISCGAYYEGDLWQMVLESGRGPKTVPVVDIMTVAATGSEFNGDAVITNPHTTEKLGAKFVYPEASICDPTYTFTTSAYQTAAGSIDIMSHVMESYFSRTDDSELSDALSESIMKSVIENMPVALAEPDNYEARANLMVDAYLGCSYILEYGKEPSGWPCHAIQHELSAYYDITHGTGLAILTPVWMRYILKKDPSVTGRFVRFARNVWGLDGDDDTELALKGIDAFDKFCKESGIEKSFAELNIGSEHFEAMAKHAGRKDRLVNSYVPLTQEDVVNIFREC